LASGGLAHQARGLAGEGEAHFFRADRRGANGSVLRASLVDFLEERHRTSPGAGKVFTNPHERGQNVASSGAEIAQKKQKAQIGDIDACKK